MRAVWMKCYLSAYAGGVSRKTLIGSGTQQHVLFVREFAMVGCFSQTVM